MMVTIFSDKKNVARFANKIFLQSFLIAALLFFSCAKNLREGKNASVSAQTRFLLNTVCAVNLYNDGSPELYRKIFDRISQIEQDFSAHVDTSFVSQINVAAGKHAVDVPDDVLFVINAAIEYARLTDGAFDPTVGVLVDLWGINTDSERVPTQPEIDAALPLINWRDIEVNGNSVMLLREKMSLDLGGIAKGFAADEIVRILQAHRVKQAIVDLGGNIYVFGKKADGSAWRVGIKNPNNPEGTPALILTLANSTVVTSGVYERFFVTDGIRYHHILDTSTGYPAQTGILSATIVCESSMTADALSTSIFLLGTERGLELLKNLDAQKNMVKVPGLDTGVSGIFITEAGNITASAALRDVLATVAGYSGKLVFE